MFIYLFREHTQAREGQREERERIPSRLHTVSAQPDLGPDPTKREIMN